MLDHCTKCGGGATLVAIEAAMTMVPPSFKDTFYQHSSNVKYQNSPNHYRAPKAHIDKGSEHTTILFFRDAYPFENKCAWEQETTR